MDDELIQTSADAQENIIQEEQTQEPQPLEYKEPDVKDTYNEVDEAQKKADFDKWLDEQYPIKGNASLEQYDKKDPSSAKRYLDDMQNNIRNDMANQTKRDELVREYKQQQDDRKWAAVYEAYPELKKNKDVHEMTRMFFDGASKNNLTPLQATKLFNKLIIESYNNGFKAARQHTETMPSKPLGKQGQSNPVRLNEKALYEKAQGSVDDVAEAVAALQKAGIGGL